MTVDGAKIPPGRKSRSVPPPVRAGASKLLLSEGSRRNDFTSGARVGAQLFEWFLLAAEPGSLRKGRRLFNVPNDLSGFHDVSLLSKFASVGPQCGRPAWISTPRSAGPCRRHR